MRRGASSAACNGSAPDARTAATAPRSASCWCCAPRVAAQLMAALEAHARTHGVTLLVLDTEAGSAAESFYRNQGWQRVGEIPAFASRADGSLMATALYFKALRSVVA
jgi:hypothetical protein